MSIAKKLLVLIAAWLVLPTIATASSSDLASRQEILAKAGPEIRNTVKELTKNSWTAEAAAWGKAKAGQAVLVWAVSESVNSLRPSYWLLSIESGGKRVGLLALEPNDGNFSWRATTLSGEKADIAKRIFSKTQEKLVEFVKSKVPEADRKKLDVEHPLTASINGSFYWVVPALGENLLVSNCFPVGGEGKKGEMWEAVKNGRSAYPSRQIPSNSGPVFDLPSPETGSSVVTGETWMVHEVPLYAKGASTGGWAFALAMVRQWWSPKELGKRADLEKVMRSFLGLKQDEGLKPNRVFEIMRRWRALDQHWDKNEGDNGVRFDDFKTLWFGSGAALSQAQGGTTWKSNDPRSWIGREGPVIVAIDSDGIGEGEEVDQYALITGHSSQFKRIYVNATYGLPDTFSHAEFYNHFWAAWYAVECDLPTLCAAPRYSRRGMIAGIPGDLLGPPAPQPLVSVPATVADSKKASITNVGVLLGEPNVPAFAGKDAFGQSYSTECTISIPKASVAGGDSKGDWSKLDAQGKGGNLDMKAIYSKILYSGGAMGGGRFDVAFEDASPGAAMTVQASCKVNDLDDRSHFQEQQTVRVFDDTNGPDGNREMRRPVLLTALGKTEHKLVIKDDDPSAPVVEMLSPYVVYDDQSRPLRFTARIFDASGLNSARVKYGFGDEKPTDYKSFSENKGSEYWIDLPRDEWIEHVGETLNFWVRATDDDNDREGDRSTVEKQFSVSIEDDDPVGPQVVQYVARRGENMQFQILVKIEDKSGLFVSANWPKLYYSFTDNVSPENFNGIAKMVAHPTLGEGWFTATAPWGEAGALQASADEKNKQDSFIYFKVRAYDLDKDRKEDSVETWSQMWTEVYLPAMGLDSKSIVDIWPAGDREAGLNTLWDNWFDPPPEGAPSILFFEGRPENVSPPPVPEVLTGPNAKIRIHIGVSLAFVTSGSALSITASSVSMKPYKMTATVVTKKGMWNLGQMVFPSEDEGGAEVSLPIPPGALSAGENIIVLVPDKNTDDYDQVAIQRIFIEANELPEPPKVDEY